MLANTLTLRKRKPITPNVCANRATTAGRQALAGGVPLALRLSKGIQRGCLSGADESSLGKAFNDKRPPLKCLVSTCLHC